MSARTFNEEAPIEVPMRMWSSKRKAYQRDGRPHLIDMTVMAVDGPTAAHIFRERVAALWSLYGPKDEHRSERADRSRRKRGLRQLQEVS